METKMRKAVQQSNTQLKTAFAYCVEILVFCDGCKVRGEGSGKEINEGKKLNFTLIIPTY